MRLEELNALDTPAVEQALLRCCGSSRWARLMAAARPFAHAEALNAKADAIWKSLDRADWLEAFATHPKIGETGRGWSAAEQAGMAGAADTLRQRLAEANRAYEARFGYIFIVCATRRSADEMLGLLERRMINPPDAELAVAAEEQRKITRLRLAKLLGATDVPVGDDHPDRA